MLFFNKIIVFFSVLLVVSCSSSDISLNSKPTDIKSSKKLAQGISNIANCTDFENDSFQNQIIFTCQKKVNKKNIIFRINIFYNEEEKNEYIKKILSSKEQNRLFKTGRYYIISESLEVGTKGNIEDFMNFPGEIFIQ